jgi:hypothetical protein
MVNAIFKNVSAIWNIGQSALQRPLTRGSQYLLAANVEKRFSAVELGYNALKGAEYFVSL